MFPVINDGLSGSDLNAVLRTCCMHGYIMPSTGGCNPENFEMLCGLFLVSFEFLELRMLAQSLMALS